VSPENVEIVRGYYRDLDHALEVHWAEPAAPFADPVRTGELLERLHPDVVWRPPFRPGGAFRGREEVRRAVSDWLDATDDWRVTVDDLIDAGGDRVFGVITVHTRGRGSGAVVDQRVFTVFVVRDGRIALIDDYTDRRDALKAAGLRE
jgi:ketosteroid isomerase-like protein